MSADVRRPKGDVDDFWDEFDWDELSLGEQKLFAALGWNERKWDGEGDVPASDKEWEELNPKEQAALTALGYDEEYWDS
jgi:hypothetical protein